MSLIRTFRYEQNSKGIWDDIKFMICYAGFLLLVSDEDYALFQDFRSRNHDTRSALRTTFDYIKGPSLDPDPNSKENQAAKEAGKRLWDNLSKERQEIYINEFLEENKRWLYYGYDANLMEWRRTPIDEFRKPPDREKLLAEPIVYEKAFTDKVHLIVHDKLWGKYTGYLLYPAGRELSRISLLRDPHILDLCQRASSVVKDAIKEQEEYDKKREAIRAEHKARRKAAEEREADPVFQAIRKAEMERRQKQLEIKRMKEEAQELLGHRLSEFIQKELERMMKEKKK